MILNPKGATHKGRVSKYHSVLAPHIMTRQTGMGLAALGILRERSSVRSARGCPPQECALHTQQLRDSGDAYRPFGLCWIVWGYISQLPISFTASGNLSPSLISASPIAFRLACWTSECLAQIILPLASMDMAGSSRPSCKWNEIWNEMKSKQSPNKRDNREICFLSLYITTT